MDRPPREVLTMLGSTYLGMLQKNMTIMMDALGGQGTAIFADLRRAGVQAVAVIRIEAIGQTQLNYYGQSDTLYNAAMTVRTFDVANRSPLFGGGRTKVDFTALNAEQKAREAIEPELRRMLSSLSAYKPGSRRG